MTHLLITSQATVCSWKVFSVLSPAGKPSLKIAPPHTQAFLYRSTFPAVLFPWLESHTSFSSSFFSSPWHFRSPPVLFIHIGIPKREFFFGWHEVSLSTRSPNKPFQTVRNFQEFWGVIWIQLYKGEPFSPILILFSWLRFPPLCLFTVSL